MTDYAKPLREVFLRPPTRITRTFASMLLCAVIGALCGAMLADATRAYQTRQVQKQIAECIGIAIIDDDMTIRCQINIFKRGGNK